MLSIAQSITHQVACIPFIFLCTNESDPNKLPTCEGSLTAGKHNATGVRRDGKPDPTNKFFTCRSHECVDNSPGNMYCSKHGESKAAGSTIINTISSTTKSDPTM